MYVNYNLCTRSNLHRFDGARKKKYNSLKSYENNLICSTAYWKLKKQRKKIIRSSKENCKYFALLIGGRFVSIFFFRFVSTLQKCICSFYFWSIVLFGSNRYCYIIVQFAIVVAVMKTNFHVESTDKQTIDGSSFSYLTRQGEICTCCQCGQVWICNFVFNLRFGTTFLSPHPHSPPPLPFPSFIYVISSIFSFSLVSVPNTGNI